MSHMSEAILSPVPTVQIQPYSTHALHSVLLFLTEFSCKNTTIILVIFCQSYIGKYQAINNSLIVLSFDWYHSRPKREYVKKTLSKNENLSFGITLGQNKNIRETFGRNENLAHSSCLVNIYDRTGQNRRILVYCRVQCNTIEYNIIEYIIVQYTGIYSHNV